MPSEKLVTEMCECSNYITSLVTHLDKLQGEKQKNISHTQTVGLFQFWFVALGETKNLHLKMSASTSHSRTHGPVVISRTDLMCLPTRCLHAEGGVPRGSGRKTHWLGCAVGLRYLLVIVTYCLLVIATGWPRAVGDFKESARGNRGM